MTARRSFVYASLLLLVATMAPGATVKSTNFIVEASSREEAEEFARLAEHYRKVKAIEWLGKEMPAWKRPCPLTINVIDRAPSGATTFDFRGDYIFQEMVINGPRERLKNSVLPHEITHTVFAHHFQQPVPRWADEGGSVYSEDDLERQRHDKQCYQIYNAGRAIQLKALFRMKDYPKGENDVMALYAQGYSITRFLVEQSDRQAFLNFVADGMYRGWDNAANKHYGFKNVDALEKAWVDFIRTGSKSDTLVSSPGKSATKEPTARLATFDSAPPAAPKFADVTRRGAAPVGIERDHDDIGWSRPRSRPTEMTPSSLRDAPSPRNSLPPTRPPAAVLLPPEPAPFR